MPKYDFICDECDLPETKFLSIDEFFKSKKNPIFCSKCSDGLLVRVISTVNSSIEKSEDNLKLDIQDEVRKIVDQVNSGDQRTIENVYGDRLNPHKK